MDFVDACVLANFENLIPSLAPVTRLVEPSISSFFPKGTLSCDKHDIRIFGMNDDLSNVFTCVQSNLFKARAAIG